MADDKKEEKKEEAPTESSDNKDEAAESGSDEQKEVEVPEKFKALVEQIEQMSVMDLSELVKILEDKFGVSSAAPMVMAGAPAAGGEGEEQAEEVEQDERDEGDRDEQGEKTGCRTNEDVSARPDRLEGDARDDGEILRNKIAHLA